MRINVEDVREVAEKVRQINSVPFFEIEWFENGEPVIVPPDRLEDWDFIGLSNMDFIVTDFYKEGYSEEK
jgi:hypothetical protein